MADPTANSQIVVERLPAVQDFPFQRLNIVVDPGVSFSLYLEDRADNDFNSRASAIGATGLPLASNAPGNVTGSGTTNNVVKWTDGPNSVIGGALMTDDGTNVEIVTTGSIDFDTTGNFRGGDVSASGNGTRFTVDDTNQVINIAAPTGTISIGDTASVGNDTRIVIDDDAETITILAPNGATLNGNPLGVGGANTQLQYNNNGAPGGITGVTTDGAEVLFAAGALKINDIKDETDVFVIFDTLIGSSNLSVGAAAGNISAVTGDFNTALGQIALRDVTTGAANVAAGSSALQSLTQGQSNVAVGVFAGINITTGNNNVAVGRNAIAGAAGASGLDNIGIGVFTLADLTSGGDNIGIGTLALQNITTGNQNVAIGRQAGDSLMTGSGNVFIGYQAGFSETGSNKLYIDNSNTATPLIGGDFSTNTVIISGTISADNLLSGVYTPALTNVANLDGSTAFECQYMRVGNVVTVSGKVSVNPTAPTASTQLGISLPIASNLGAQEDCAGCAFASGIAGQGAAILGDAANNRAQMEWVSGDVTDQPMYFTFTYQII